MAKKSKADSNVLDCVTEKRTGSFYYLNSNYALLFNKNFQLTLGMQPLQFSSMFEMFKLPFSTTI